jgi:hypothetical protein
MKKSSRVFTSVSLSVFALLASLMLSGMLRAETIVYQALDDFPSTESGEVPYYVEDGRGTLAINASLEAYRDKFARATTTFSGAGGSYDVTINTLGEKDGECEYRLLVNDVVVATVVNDSTTEEFEEQFHTFTDIQVPAGATLSIESNAVSNGLIPEGDAFAFARGRWRSLTLENDVQVSVDLQISGSVDSSSLEVDDNFNLDIDISNQSNTVTATAPIVTIAVPASVTVDTPTECSLQSGGNLTCALPEIAPNQSASIRLPGTASSAGTADIDVAVTADQSDDDASDNSASVSLEIDSVQPPTPTVDLQLAMSSASDSVVAGDSVEYTLTVTNADTTTVATEPSAGVVLPDNLQFESSADCSSSDANVLCSLPELAPGESIAASFVVTALSAGESTLIASVSAIEPELVTSDNEVVADVTVIAASPATPVDESAVDNTDASDSQNAADGEGGNGGGGAMFLLVLLPLLGRRLQHR